MAKKSLPIANAPRETGVMIKPSAEDKARERRYRAEDALRDIERAEGHKKDKNLMSDVKSLAKEKMNTMKKIC